MRSRLIVTIVSTIGELVVTAIVAVFVLPRFGISIPLPAVALIMLGWVGWSVFTYRKGTEALLRKPVANLVDMTGCSGTVAKALHPDGLVKLNGELWSARTLDKSRIDPGAAVVVVGQDRLRLLVRADDRRGPGSPPVGNRDDDQGNADNRQREG